MKKKALLLLLSLSLAFLVALSLSACGHDHEYSGDWSSDATHHWHSAACEHTEEVSDKGEHTFDGGVTAVEPTTTTAGEKTFTCSVCGYVKTEVIPPLSTEAHTHSFTDSTVAATCAERGYTAHTCTCGVTYADNYTEKTPHVVASYTSVGDGTHTGICTLGHTVTVNCTFTESVCYPGCSEQGYTAFTCSVCAYSYCDNYVSALGHSYNREFEHNDSYHWHSANCSHSNERSEYSPHTYTETVTAPTCTEGGYTTYTCGCGYSFIGSRTAPLGHTVLEWRHEGSSLLDAEKCAYTETYSGTCSVCFSPSEKVEVVEKHDYYWAITTPATCKTEGVKTYICANEECRYHTPTSASETYSYTDTTAHKWVKDEDASSESITVHKCSVTGCNETKSIVLSASDNVSVSDTVLNSTSEITLPEATINFDSDIKTGLSGQGQVSVSATTLGTDERESAINAANLTDVQRKALKGKKIYSFTLSTDTNNDIHELGGKAKISLPYTLSDGETPEDVVVWYLADGSLLAKAAVYYEDADGNGFVSFETEHFSSYTVGALTPAERCEKFGHVEKVFTSTCTESGYCVCIRCNKILEVTRPLGHNFHSEVTRAATCSSNGEMTVECLACGHSFTELIPAVGHNYRLSDYKPSGCLESGHSAYTCTYCNDSYSVLTPALSHDYMSTVKAATCTEGGYTEKTCKRCAATVTVDNVAPLGHSYSAVWSTLADGHYHVCTVCAGRSEIDAHIPGTPATETTAEVCSVCEYVITPALGHTHTLTKVDAIAPGCLTGGNSEYYICLCGKWFADAAGAQLITDHTAVFLDAKGHTPVSIPAVDATCTEGGFTAGLKCSVCDKLIRGHVATSPTGHSHSKAVTAPTCGTGGYTVYTCHCGDTYTADATEPLGHKLVSTVTAPTCEAGGYTTDNCVRCQYSARHSEREALGHSYSESYTATETEHYNECVRCSADTEHKAHIPDCDAATEEHGIKCTVCEYEIAAAVNHTHRVDKTVHEKAATCTAAGNLAYYTCTCGDRFLDAACTVELTNISDAVVKATGHKIVTFGAKDPTCTENGHSAGAKCERCDEVLSGGEVITALGHLEITVPGTAASCTEAGREDGTMCDRCKITLTVGATIPSLGHIETEVPAISATCTETGRESGIKCGRCSTVLSGCGEISPLGHNEVTVPGTPATCTESGVGSGVKCGRCNEVLRVGETISPLGHDESVISGYPASCTEPGTTDEVSCLRCGETLEESTVIPALGHSYSDGACTNCGASEPEGEKTVVYTYEMIYSYDNTTEIYRFRFFEDGVVEQIGYSYVDGELTDTSSPDYASWIMRNGYVVVETDGYKTAFAVKDDGVALEMITSLQSYLKYHYVGSDSMEGFTVSYLYFFTEDGKATVEYEVVTSEGSVVDSGRETAVYVENDTYLLMVHAGKDVIAFTKSAGGLTPYEPENIGESCTHGNKMEISTTAATCYKPAATNSYCPDCGSVSSSYSGDKGEHTYRYGYCFACGKPEDDTEWNKSLLYVAILEESILGAPGIIPKVYFYTNNEAVLVTYNENTESAEYDGTAGEWRYDDYERIVVGNMCFRVTSDGFTLIIDSYVTPDTATNTFVTEAFRNEDGTTTYTVTVRGAQFASVSLEVHTDNGDLVGYSTLIGGAVSAEGDTVRFVWFNESYENVSGAISLISVTVRADAEIKIRVNEMYTVSPDGSFYPSEYSIQ